jgi:hypothetical protein
LLGRRRGGSGYYNNRRRVSIAGMGIRYRLAGACLAAVAAWGGPVTAQTSGASTPVPALTFAFELRAQVGPPVEIGTVPHGRRRIVPILGGTVKGPSLSAKVVPGGADWQLIQPDGFSELDTRYTLETDKGELVYVQNAGIRHAPPEIMQKLLAGQSVDPKLVYFRTVPKFETSAPDLQWLARSVFVGVGERFPTEVVVRFYRLE